MTPKEELKITLWTYFWGAVIIAASIGGGVLITWLQS